MLRNHLHRKRPGVQVDTELNMGQQQAFVAKASDVLAALDKALPASRGRWVCMKTSLNKASSHSEITVIDLGSKMCVKGVTTVNQAGFHQHSK